mgnify:CR=1 FL=1
MKAIRIEKTGGADVMALRDVDLPAPGPGQIRVRHTAIGINFIDIYHRTGLYPVPLPSGLGLEAAGVVEALGEGVTAPAIGTRVGYCSGPIGAYAEAANVPAGRVVALPASVPDEFAASSMLKGMTAQYLLKRTYAVKPGETILFHAAAGGVGQIAVQWAKALGATVIGTVGDAKKAEIVKALGCDHVVNSRTENIAERVRAITKGEGVPVVYDSIGKDTFMASLDSLAVRGLLVSFGNASGAVPAFEPGILSAKGSLYLTRPTLFHYTRDTRELQETADDLFAILASGKVKIAPPARYALADAAKAHADLEGRRTAGALVLVP